MAATEPLILKNILHQSRSPYVRRHAANPVAWQEWTPEAISLAKKYNRLLFVSIGYAACHWCHIMEKESFMNAEVASCLNENFIPIKVDREERPDIDSVYLQFCQATTGSGGWPLNVFLTPDLEPVFGGTYWPGPNSSSFAREKKVMAFLDILNWVKNTWNTQQEKCRSDAGDSMRQLKEFAEEGTHSFRTSDDGQDSLELDLLEEAYQHFASRFDIVNGGFSTAPKFPTPVNLLFLLKLGQFPDVVKDIVGQKECENARYMAIHTLRMMARGGIRDQIGFGFHRYSVTKDWNLPHFEKMLYDNAQLLDVYLDAFEMTGDPEMFGVVCELCAKYLASPPIACEQGGFFSSENADSLPSPNDTEKREGAYYVWTLKELRQVLGEQAADVAARFWNVKANGNIPGENDVHDEFISQNCIHIIDTPGTIAPQVGIAEKEVALILKASRQKLRNYREQVRPRPSLDDKIVVSWNGLAIAALARCSIKLRDLDPETAKISQSAAVKSAAFIIENLFNSNSGQLWRVYREGKSGTPGFASDYAFFIHGLIELYEATFDDQYLEIADKLQSYLIKHFQDPDQGGFFTSSGDMGSPVPLRLKAGTDDSEPSTNGIIAQNLFRLSSLLGDDEYKIIAQKTCQAFASEMIEHPFLFVTFLSAIVMNEAGMKNIVHIGDGTYEKIRRCYGAVTTITDLGPKAKSEWLKTRNNLLKSITDLQTARTLICGKDSCRQETE
ncbi:MAG: hypothetical protein M1834_007042 [Cirrosporium novae-zelandiae]|nr:MAG: hypothetical protein M1834_007042 [Cirrosporium novae-zelandiae]